MKHTHVANASMGKLFKHSEAGRFEYQKRPKLLVLRVANPFEASEDQLLLHNPQTSLVSAVSRSEVFADASNFSVLTTCSAGAVESMLQQNHRTMDSAGATALWQICCFCRSKTSASDCHKCFGV